MVSPISLSEVAKHLKGVKYGAPGPPNVFFYYSEPQPNPSFIPNPNPNTLLTLTVTLTTTLTLTQILSRP